MTDVIHLLPDRISNQIAAGEVIQRPSSAVKELMENSIDAGASQIKVIIKNAGKSLIQVLDDGCGMSENDARMCFHKHATSKIKSVEELFAIRTKGFRGEALASIAAIAQVELKTKIKDKDTGFRITIDGSEVKSQMECAVPTGSSVTVKNLFFNVPARRKFLKSNTAETKHIIDEFQRVCLAHPDVAFSLYNDDKLVYDIKPSNVRKRIVALLGDNYNERLVPVSESTDYVSVDGFIGKPEFARKTRGEQFLFVNDRFIKSKYINHAVYSAYEQMIHRDSFPMFVLFLSIDPARVDVNVHPSKNEVKFDDDRLIYTIVNAGIKHALAQYSITPSLDFDVEQGLGSLPGFYSDNSNTGFNTNTIAHKKSDPANWKDLYPEVEGVHQDEQESSFEPVFKPHQLHLKYILTQIKSGLVLIDQQAAHERILFEEFVHKMENNKVTIQQLLFPKKVTFASHESEIISQFSKQLKELGVEMEKFGENTFIIQGIPPELKQNQLEAFFEKVIEYFNVHKSLDDFDIYAGIAKSLAYSASIKRGETLNTEEMQNLIDRLFACSNPNVNPDKHKCFIQFDLNEIDKKFTEN